MDRTRLAILGYLFCGACFGAPPLEQLGVKPGTTHRMTLGSGEIDARTVEIGRDGWVLFVVESNSTRWTQGSRLWINLDRIDNISTPLAGTGASTTPTTLSESEISQLPCFPQADQRDALSAAKGLPFDRNRFLTECIGKQRKK